MKGVLILSVFVVTAYSLPAPQQPLDEEDARRKIHSLSLQLIDEHDDDDDSHQHESHQYRYEEVDKQQQKARLEALQRWQERRQQQLQQQKLWDRQQEEREDQERLQAYQDWQDKKLKAWQQSQQVHLVKLQDNRDNPPYEEKLKNYQLDLLPRHEQEWAYQDHGAVVASFTPGQLRSPNPYPGVLDLGLTPEAAKTQHNIQSNSLQQQGAELENLHSYLVRELSQMMLTIGNLQSVLQQQLRDGERDDNQDDDDDDDDDKKKK